MRRNPLPNNGRTVLFYTIFSIIILLTGNSCKKTAITELQHNNVVTAPASNAGNLASRTIDELDEWLSDKAVEFGEEGGLLIERMTPLLKLGDKYSEDYHDENIVVIPIDYNSGLTEHIRSDLPQPLQFLLVVEDEYGEIRRGDLVMFYPDSSISNLPIKAFSDFFTTQTFPVDGTFQLISLNDIKQYEMDIDKGNPKELRLMEGRAPVYDGDEIVCIDWWEVTTIYYDDGTIEQYVDFLYTQCYGGSGGGGGGTNGTTPPVLNHYPVTKTVTFLVDQQLPQGTLEHWSMYASFVLTGECYPNNPSSNYFTSAPTLAVSNGFAIVWGFGMHLNPGHSWYITHSPGTGNSGLHNSKNAWASFSATLSYPNQPNKASRNCFKSKNWPASILVDQSQF